MQGDSDPAELAKLGDFRLQCSQEELADALRGQWQPLHRQMLQLFLERLALLDRQTSNWTGWPLRPCGPMKTP